MSILSSAILSRLLSKTEYGNFKQVMFIYTTLLIVFTAGLPRVFSYYLPKYTLEEGKSIVIKISTLLFFSGIFFSLVLYFGADLIALVLKNPKLAYNLRLFSPVPAFLLPTLGIDGVFSSYKKTQYTAIYNTITRILMLGCIVVPVILIKKDCATAILGWTIVSVLTFILALFFKNIPFKEIKKIQTNLTYREMFAYSLPIVYASLWGTAIKSADQFFISRYFGTEVFAEYSNGFIEIPLVSMVTGATSSIMMPLLSKMIHDKTPVNEIAVLWQNVLTKSALIIYPIVIFCVFYSKEIMLILYSEKYANSAIYFQFSMILNLFNIIIFAPIIFAMGETKFYANMHLYSAIATWVIGFLVVTLFHSPIYYAIFSTFMACLRVIVALYFVSTKLKIAIINLFPFRICFLIVLQSALILFPFYYFSKYFFQLQHIHNVVIIAVSVVFFSISILATAKFFKLNYWIVLQPLLRKIKVNV